MLKPNSENYCVFCSYGSIKCNGEQGAKEAGKMRVEGKDYEVQDRDVVLFRFNV